MQNPIPEFRVSERSAYISSKRRCGNFCKCGRCDLSLNNEDKNSIEFEICVHTNAPNSLNRLKLDEKSFNVNLKHNEKQTRPDFIIQRIYGENVLHDINYKTILTKNGFDSEKIDRFIDFINTYLLDYVAEISDEIGDIYSFRKDTTKRIECLEAAQKEQPF